jgi:hypothetical protein
MYAWIGITSGAVISALAITGIVLIHCYFCRKRDDSESPYDKNDWATATNTDAAVTFRYWTRKPTTPPPALDADELDALSRIYSDPDREIRPPSVCYSL